MFADVPVDEDTAAQLGDLLDIAQFLSMTLRLQVFYALLYVVVEGYRELGCEDAAVDRLLAQSENHVDALRKFRNAVFHPQEQPISPKIAAFVNAKGSENWIYDLYRALKAFFESELPIKELLAKLAQGPIASSPTEEP